MIRQATSGLLAAKTADFARLGFSEAADRYLEDRRAELAEASYKKERQLLVQPKLHFRSIPLRKLKTQDLLDYRMQRQKTAVGAVILNMEMAVIGRMLRKAKRWNQVAADIKPLRQTGIPVGRALQPDQKKKLLETAAMKPEWLVTWHASQLTLNTTMRGCELKSLRWRNIDFENRLLRLEHSKTQAGVRTIPLNQSAYEALLGLQQRSRDLGVSGPDHYVFPACEHGRIDATKPQKSWRTSWRRLTNEAGLKGLRFHDLRHHAVTELAESQASEQTILSIAGHISRRMLEHYSHVRIEAKRDALDALAGKEVKGESNRAYVTNHVTKPSTDELPCLQTIQNAMGATGIEPMTSTVSR